MSKILFVFAGILVCSVVAALFSAWVADLFGINQDSRWIYALNAIVLGAFYAIFYAGIYQGWGFWKSAGLAVIAAATVLAVRLLVDSRLSRKEPASR